MQHLREHLPPPGTGTQMLVCGQDEFLERITGGKLRGPPAPGQKKGDKLTKFMNPDALLAQLGFTADNTYKF